MKTFMAYVRHMLSNKAYVMNVFAEEITPTKEEDKEENPDDKKEPEKQTSKEDPKPSGTLNFEDLVRKAREEEKGKLYPQIEKLKGEKNDLLVVIAERDATIADLQKEAAKYKDSSTRLSTELKEGTKANKTVSELTVKVGQLERQLEEAQMNHEKELNKVIVGGHKEKLLAKAGDEIIPELVVGETVEELDEAFERAVARYTEITSRAYNGQQMPRTNPNAASIQLTPQVSDAEVAQMSMKEYTEYRNKLGIK